MSAPNSLGKSKKRSAASDDAPAAGEKRTVESKAAADSTADEEELEFEDPYGDEMDDEEEKEVAAAVAARKSKKKGGAGAAPAKPADADAMMDDGEEGDIISDDDGEEEEILDEEAATKLAAEEDAAAEAAAKATRFVWRPQDKMNADEQLDYDSTAYHMLHRMHVDWPCLSFDILPDQLGAFRNKYPMTMYMVAGTQATHANKNKVMILKASDLHKTKHDDRDEDDEEESDSDDDDLDENATLEEKSFAHQGGVNRIRVCPQQPNIIATHADTANMHIWDIKPYVDALDKPGTSLQAKPKPIHTQQLASEGYAMAWNPNKPGQLVVGDTTKNIHLLDPVSSGNGWALTTTANGFKGHSSSIEDFAWSPSEASVFASASSDKTVRMWDARTGKCEAFVPAHRTDVNVIDWNARVQHLLVSGADDGQFKIWDLRKFKASTPAATFNWHCKDTSLESSAITSVEWHPIEESCVAVASADNSITIWDLALEADELPGHGAQVQQETPPQLYFEHRGQTEIKEIHWHKQIPSALISTAADGFNIFKPSNFD